MHKELIPVMSTINANKPFVPLLKNKVFDDKYGKTLIFDGGFVEYVPIRLDDEDPIAFVNNLPLPIFD